MPERRPTYSIEGTFILALDASTTAVGWCYARDGDYIASGVHKPKGKDAWTRINRFGEWLYGLIESTDTNVVVLEEPTGRHGNARTDRLLGAVLGAARVACGMRGAQFELVNVMKAKATGYGKDNVWASEQLIGKQGISGDEADAVAVWQAWLVQRGDCHEMREG